MENVCNKILTRLGCNIESTTAATSESAKESDNLTLASLTEVFKKLDKDGDGKIEYDEFVEGLEKLNVGLSKQEMYDFMRVIDKVRIFAAVVIIDTMNPNDDISIGNISNTHCFVWYRNNISIYLPIDGR